MTTSLGGGTATDLSTAEPPEKEWEYSVSVSTYVPLHSQDYANPIITADHDWFHAEARYNYEALKTGSLWLGYNFSFGEKVEFEATPMVGGVFGNSTGFAPGYNISITWESVEFFTHGEYFIDANTHAENFFYTWSELSYSLTSWLHAGIVVDRTKTLGSNIDIRRGPLLGVRYRNFDFTTYWLSPGTREATFVFATTMTF